MTGHAEVDAILERAHRYLCEVYEREGHYPDQFLVSESEYRSLQRGWTANDIAIVRSFEPDLMYQVFGMLVIRETWRPSNPEVDAILERARCYQAEYYAREGYPPDRFLVSEHEYESLQRHYGGPPVPPVTSDLQIMGMRVVKPVRMPWYRDNRAMEHFKISALNLRPLQQWDPLPCMSDALERCLTNLPLYPCRTMTCPYGEVIWEMSSYTGWRPSQSL